jgi:hypothetical protein
VASLDASRKNHRRITGDDLELVHMPRFGQCLSCFRGHESLLKCRSRTAPLREKTDTQSQKSEGYSQTASYRRRSPRRNTFETPR